MTNKEQTKRETDPKEEPANPLSAIAYLRDIRPEKFKLLYSLAGIYRGVKIYGPTIGRECDSDKDVRMGIEPEEGDIHIITKNLDLSAQELRALPAIDFQYPQLIAFQVNNFIDKDGILPNLKKEIDTLCLVDLVNRQESLNGLEFSYASERAYWDSMDRGVKDYNFFYQFMTFPLRRQHVEGMIEVAEKFYSPQGKRSRLLEKLDLEIEKFKQSFLDDACASLRIPNKDGIKLIRGRCIAVPDDAKEDSSFSSGIFPINKYAKELSLIRLSLRK